MKRALLCALLTIVAAAAEAPGLLVKPVILPPEAKFSVRHPSGRMLPGGPDPRAQLVSGTEFVIRDIGGERGVVVAARCSGYEDFEKSYALTQGKDYWDPALPGWRIPIEMTPVGPLNFIRHQFRFHGGTAWSVVAGLGLILLIPIVYWARKASRAGAQVKEQETLAWQARLKVQELEDKYNPDLTGKEIGEYLLVRKLGEGAYAQVYEARHKVYQDAFAVKLIHRHAADEQTLRRVHRELEIGRTLNHPNLVRIVAFGDFHGAPYLVMDYVDGPTLSQVLEKPLPQKEVLRLFRQMCQGVAYAHSHGVIHRDLKPDNMILTPAGVLKILDFGVARPVQDLANLTATGQGLGTPAYMAPEQLLGNPSLASDVYALGVILFLLLTSRLPFAGQHASDVLSAHLVEKAPAPSSLVPEIPPELDLLCLSMLEKSVAHRIASVDEVLERLDYLENEGGL